MQQQNTQKVEASKVPEYIKKAAKKAAEFNSNLNRERMEERRAYFDLQTHVGSLMFTSPEPQSLVAVGHAVPLSQCSVPAVCPLLPEARLSSQCAWCLLLICVCDAFLALWWTCC